MKSLKNDCGTAMNKPFVYLPQVREFSVKEEKGTYTKQLVVVVGNT